MTQECSIDKIKNVLSELLKQLNEIPLSKKAIINNNEQTSERQSDEKSQSDKKRPSLWAFLTERIIKSGKVRKEAAKQASDSGGSQGGSSSKSKQNIGDDQENADLVIQKLQSDIRQMQNAFEKLTHFQNQMSKSLEVNIRSDKLRAILQKTDSIKSRSHDLNDIRRKIFYLKCQIPSLLLKQSSRGINITGSQTSEENDKLEETGSDIYLPGLHVSPDFRNSSAFEEVVEKFKGLTDFNMKLCLLSFAVFPENREVKRTMLMYWWIGEGFIRSDDSEKAVRGILKEFSAKGLVEPVEDERKLKPNSYKMAPHVHSAVIYLAESVNLFDLYSSKGKLIMKKSSKDKVCLVKGSSLQPEAKTSAMQPKNLKTIFNSSERYPDFTFKWFPFMDSLRVLYLGRWERTAKRHIEVESTKFLKNMKVLKNLRLASFQGISRIEKLENSICALPKLVILDLRACYNLEVLPDDISLLGNLIYLDVSECFMLDRMPEGIAQLSKLQVLKGFVISESDDEHNCAVKHLVNLRKLSITVNRFLFKVENMMESLRGLKQLESLKISWGARFPEDDQRGGKSQEPNEAEENKETTNEEKENQRDPATEKKKEQEGEQVQKKGQSSKEKKGDVGETGKRKVGPEDGASSKKEDEKANLEEGNKQDEVIAETLKSDKVVEGEKKTSPSQEATKTIQNKLDDQKGKSKVEEGKKSDEVKAKSMKSDKVIEEEKKTSPSQEKTKTVQGKANDQKEKSKVEDEGDGDNGKADLEEEKKSDEVKEESLKSEKNASTSREATGTIQDKPDDHKGENKGENKVEGDGDKGKDDLKEGKKEDEVKEEKSKSEKVGEGDEKKNPPQESKDTIQNKTYDKSKVEKEGDGDKGKADPEEEMKHDEVEAKSSKSGNGVEGVKKANPSGEPGDAIQNKRVDHQRGDKQEEKNDGEKEKVNLEEGKKKEEVIAESSKPDKVIEGVEKTNPPRESNDTYQNKRDDHKENNKVQGKGDGPKNGDDFKNLNGGEAKTQKSDKPKKFGKKVSFSENSIALIEKKPDDLKRDSAMGEEIHGTLSLSKPEKAAPKESGSRKANPFMKLGTMRWGRRHQEITAIDTPKLPSSLKKLELECFPDEDPPGWLNPKNLDKLKKLSIKGGMLSKISNELPIAENSCQVQILRLKYLLKFKAEWKDLKELFPDLKLFEKYKCPKIAFCPTDGNGVWRSQPQTSPNM